MINYMLVAAAWVATCLMLGLYITGRGIFKGKKGYLTGLKFIFVSYLIGICMLGFMLIYF